MNPLGGWVRRRPPPPAAAAPHAFDAVVSLGPYNMPPDLAPGRAVAAVRQAVQAMPGASWISVEHHPFGPAEGAVEVFPAGGCGPGADETRQRIERTVESALDALARTRPTTVAFADPPAARPFQPGFSDGQDFGAWTPDAAAITHDPAPAGLHGVADTELLTRLLAHILPAGAAEAADSAVARFGSFAAVLSAAEIDLRKLPGLGAHSIAAIKLLHEAALRLSRGAIMDQPLLDGSDALIGYLTAALARENIEHFRILFLDSEGRLRADEAQARGTVNHTPVYPREVVRRALELKAASVILVHNHPSGDPSPSRDDIAMTATIAEAASALGLAVRDHIIVGNGRWLSFRKEGLL